MAGIFNLFGGINQPDKSHGIKSTMKPKATSGVTGTFSKSGVLGKPKGLSMRSTSDLNIPSVFNSEEQGMKDHLSAKVTQLDTYGRPASPQNKACSVSKINAKPIKMEEMSQKKKSPIDGLKLSQVIDDNVFKKPLPYEKYAKLNLYPKPENLAPYCDMEPSIDLELANIDKEFEKFMRIKEEENLDEGFESEPDDLLFVDIPFIRLSPISYKERAESPGLPEISDYEDF